jgi:hypothetical protein
MGIESYSTNPAANNAAPPNGWPEGMARSAVNDCARQNMADLRAWYEEAEWINYGYTHVYVSGTQFTIGGGVDRTATYHPGRRIRAQGSGTGTIYGTISASSYSAPTNTVTVSWDSGAMANESLTVSLHILSGNNTALPAVLARSGTKLLFPGISAAPAGWSIDTTAAYDKAAIRVRTSASTSTGGSVDFETAFANGSTGSYTLTTADIPSHSHGLNSHTHDLSNHTHGFTAVLSVNMGQLSAPGSDAFVPNVHSAGTTGGPSPNVTGAASGNTANAGGGGGHSHSLSLAVKYLDACVCVKT